MKPKMYRKTKESLPEPNRFKDNDGGGMFKQVPLGPTSSVGEAPTGEFPNVEELERNKFKVGE